MLDVMGQSNNGPDPLRVPVQSVTNFTIAEILRPEFGSRAETQKKTNSPSICLSQGIVRPVPYPRPCGLPFARKAIKSETLAFEAPTSPPRNRRKRIEGVFSSVPACNRCHGGEGSVLTSNRTKSEEDVSVSQAHTGPRCESHGLRQSSGTERPLSADNVLCRTRTDRSSALDDRLPVSKDDVSSPDSPAKEAPGKDRKAPVWPAWVYCTRYSDRPSSGPRSRKVNRKPKPPEEKRPRTAFTSDQLEVLQREFSTCRYLTETRRHNLATELQLNESQIKIWFQNKRAKLKKSSGDHGPLARVLLAQGLYNHSASPSTTGPAEDSGEQ